MQQQTADAPQGVPLEDHIGIVSHEAGGGPQVDDGPGLGAGQTEGVDMGHHIVPQLPLLLSGHGIIDVRQMLPHLRQLLVGDGKPKLLLAFRQGEPEPAPGGKLPVIGKDLLHLPAGIAAAQRVFIDFVHIRSSFSGVGFTCSPAGPWRRR